MPRRSTFALLVLLATCVHAQQANPRVVERYKQMLAANPAEGIALDRLWKAATEAGGTAELIGEYAAKTDFSGRMIHGHLLRRAGRQDEAARAFEEAAELDSASPLPAQALASLETDRGNAKQAAEWLAKAVAVMPKDDSRLTDTLLRLGAAWQRAGDRVKAAEAWERTVALTPANLEVRRQLAKAYADNQLIEPAIRHLEYLAAHAPPADAAAAWQQIARLHSGAGHPGKALEALERAVKLTSPENWLRAELLGQIIRLAQRQQAEGALEAKWKAQAEANPRDLGAALQMLEFYERTGNLEEQTAWLEKITALLPRNAEYRLRLARALVQADELETASVQFERLLADQPGNTELVFERAQLDLLLEKQAEARQRIAALLEQRKDDASLRARALEFYQQHRLLDRVEEHLEADGQSGAEEPLLALAEFYFDQRRQEEAEATLGRLIRPGQTPAEKAALSLRAALAWKGQNGFPAALRWLEKAIALQPDRRDLYLVRGELKLALQQFDAARQSFARAFALSADGEERLEADAKLFETFRAETPPADQDGNAVRTEGATLAARVEGFIRELMLVATEEKDVASWLRVARWKAWNSDRASAVRFGVKAAELDPKNPAPREFLAKLGANHGDKAMALHYLRELVELNFAKRDGYLREIAQLELQRGQSREALSILAELARLNPGNPEPLADLARAQERIGQLEPALENWSKAVAGSAPPRRREFAASYVRVLQRLGRHEAAAEWLLREIDATADERERSRQFDELLLHAKQHDLLHWLKTEFTTRRKVRADDYFITTALARILKLSGDAAGAFELFADAVYSAPDQAEALPALVREAEDMQRLEVAVRLQEQLTRIAAQDHPDDLLKLAALYLRTGDLEGAERTWGRAVAKFPRETDVIRGAADFQQQWGDPARATPLLRKLVALEPADVRAALDWGEAELAAGGLDHARTAFEAVMRLTKPVTHRLYPAATVGSPWGEKGLFVGTSRIARTTAEGVRLSTQWRTVPQNLALAPDAEAELRLQAVSRLGSIAQREGGAVLAKWIADWTSSLPTQTTDALWALYFAGERSQVLAETEKVMLVEPQVLGHPQAFVWMALESGAFGQLERWLNADGRAAADLDRFAQGFAAWAEVHPQKLDFPALDALFPRGDSVRIWPIALELARQQRFAGAIRLAERAWENFSTQRAFLGRDLARWHLALGQIAEAKRVLRATAQFGGDSLEAPPYLAMWELSAMLDAPERERFLKTRLDAAKDDSVSAVMTRLVCHLLARSEPESLATLEELLRRRPLGPPGVDESNSSVRAWNFRLTTANQLIAWGRPDLARVLWERAFADPGAVAWWRSQKVRERIAGRAERATDFWTQRRTGAEEERRAYEQLRALEYLQGGPVERARLMSAASDAEDLKNLGESLEGLRALADAAAVFHAAWQRDPADPALLRKLLEAAREAGDATMSEAVRRQCLQERLNPGNDTSPREFAVAVADLMEQRGAVPEAIEVLDASLRREKDFRVALKRAQLLDRTTGRAEATKAWAELVTMDGGNVYDRNALALELERRGEAAEALAVRTAAGSDAQVPGLLLKLGRTEEALSAAEMLTGADAVYAAVNLADALGIEGEDKLARAALLSAASRTTEPRAQMQLRAKLLTIPEHPPSRSLIARTQARLRTLAGRHPELAGLYYEFFSAEADRLGIAGAWEDELRREWAEGRGSLEAGGALVRRHLVAKAAEPARTVVEQILARQDATAEWLAKLAQDAARFSQADLHLRLAEGQARRGWPAAEPTFDFIRLLDRTGRREQARQTLASVEWLTAHRGGAEMLGHEWLALGDAERARTFLEEAWREDPLIASPTKLAGMARVQIAAKRLPAARILLQRTFALPHGREYTALIEYLVAKAQLGQWPEAMREFPLSEVRAHEFRVALFGYFERGGRFREALALVAAWPTVVSTEAGQVTCARLRALARKSGEFDATGRVLDLLAGDYLHAAEAERVALEADRAATAGEDVRPHLQRAAELAPASWEFQRRLAEAHMAAGEKGKAREVLRRFLAVAVVPGERAAAVRMF